jgi:general secretion pathway protein D
MDMTMKNRLPALCAAVSIAALLVASCATPPADSGSAKPPSTSTAAHRVSPVISPALDEAARRTRLPSPDPADDAARIYKGTGVVVKGQVPGGGLPPAAAAQVGGGNVVLNFEGADLREVVKNILGDILNEAYTIDAAVGGVVTIRTSSGIPRDALPRRSRRCCG